MNISNQRYTAEARSSLEARFGLRIAARLELRSQMPRHDVDERLRVAREQALARARAARSAVAAAEGVVVSGGARGESMVLGGQPGWWVRFGSVLPLLVLVVGLFVIDQRLDEQQMAAAAEIDSALLSDDLPPSAYSDAGFAEFLKSEPQ